MLSSANTAVIYFEPHCVKLGLRYSALYDKYAVTHMLRGTFAFPLLFLFRLCPCGPVMVIDRGQSYNRVSAETAQQQYTLHVLPLVHEICFGFSNGASVGLINSCYIPNNGLEIGWLLR